MTPEERAERVRQSRYESNSLQKADPVYVAALEEIRAAVEEARQEERRDTDEQAHKIQPLIERRIFEQTREACAARADQAFERGEEAEAAEQILALRLEDIE